MKNRMKFWCFGKNAMFAAMWQVMPIFFVKLTESSPFVSSNKFENISVTPDFCVAVHGSTVWSLEHCQYNILLIPDKDMNDFFTKLDHFCSNFQQVDRFHTFFRYTTSRNVSVKSGEYSLTMERVVSSEKSLKVWTKCPALPRRDSSIRNQWSRRWHRFRNHN